MLKILNGAKLAQDTTTGDIYLVDCHNGPVRLTDARKLVGIAVTRAPTKTTYTVGEEFDPAGMVVTATYDDGSTSPVTGYAYTPDAALTAEDTTITIAYLGKTAEQAITVNEG